ncbi:saccharopine dehydrogenase NADP-binding domain-containing protein [Sabulilitoribacter arenilitoris]|uniref:Saccharopine dehydrogenase NADP-binding domain-containing protein n=1 Tax=Wocania arenilitoris TaxID=2044858 RepID=A0AAE3ERP1_9FLAO|nr:saccharopine dehydrogenase C-terminal domain-containing protein [Wocania arenilitoris]MCF7568845.1 saccharopine dehydrogenase NADP-binding domain-containing protein [Wocania arenilitoris]
MKKKVLILGAGMIVKPIVHYLLDNNVEVTLASRTKEKAEKVLDGYSNGSAVAWSVGQDDILNDLIINHDLVVSLLPYIHHVMVAKRCIFNKTNMLTTSYVSKEMKDLDKDAKEAGVIILNELGVDPGFDHMTAMEIIDRVHGEGGSVNEFYSLCGALCAPEASNNPFKYKFSWSPKGVVMASNNDAQFLKNGKVVKIETSGLFKNPLKINFPNIGNMEVYPNRDSLEYISIYDIPEVKTMYRGTFRYKNWCEALDLLKELKLTTYAKLNLKGKTFAEITANLNGFDVKSLKQEIKDKFKIDDSNSGLKAIEWLGVLDTTPVHLEKGSAFDLVSDLMVEKMMLGKTERDMVIMQHIFKITKSNGDKETIVSRLLDYGNKDYTSIARTVALPAAIGVKLILEEKITDTGVHIPIKKSIYAPILKELKALGISMNEQIEDVILG